MSDLENIQRCARQAYALYVPRLGREPAPMVADFKTKIEAGDVHIIEADREMAGYIVFYPQQDHILVENIAIFPGHQGRGLGRALLFFAEQQARQRNLAAVELYTNIKMTENQKFYPHLGYVETDRQEQDGFTRIFYRKDL